VSSALAEHLEEQVGFQRELISIVMGGTGAVKSFSSARGRARMLVRRSIAAFLITLVECPIRLESDGLEIASSLDKCVTERDFPGL
jgi:hypothetical protein